MSTLTVLDEEVVRLRRALRDLVMSLPDNLECKDFHHNKNDRHSWDEGCKPMGRYFTAKVNAQQLVGS